MAEALLGIAFENLNSLLQNELSTLFGIRSKADKLSTTLDLIKAVLEDAEKRQFTDRAIKVWLQQLKDAVYVLDDILDECSIKSNRLKGSSCFQPMNIMFRRDIGKRLKEITSTFDEIADRKNKFLLQEGVTAKEMTIEVAEWRQTSSIIAEPEVYGREDDKEKIVQFLLNQARDSNSLSVYPIVGLGGVGKTTLTQLVYNDQRVSSTTDFDTKIWVCVSESFSVKRILCSIIESIKSEKCDALDLDVIQKKVQTLLQGKRFLLVLDDVWHKNEELKFGLSQEKWNQLKSVLSSGSKGSSCLVSTRDEVVASIMGTCQAHHLSGLSENECWLLFKQYAFGIDREEQVELVEIGKEIAKRCKGLPLAAQALGGLMRSRSTEKEWLEIKESRLWDSPSDNYILPALTLSYSYLTPTLKQCFTFCAIFPKDRIMLKEELIHLWMAHGFISSRNNLEVEDVGSMIWNELCQKSLFQDIKTNEYSGATSFKMHDLVHDLAQSIMGQEYCINCVRLPSIGKLQSLKTLILDNMDNIKYLDEGSHDGMEVMVFPSLEVLILYELRNIEGLLKVERGDIFPCLSRLDIVSCPKLGLLPCLPSLKQLDVSGCNNELLRSISTFCSLTSLFLGRGDEGITSFPEGMFTNLTFLQTLRIFDFPKLKELPNQPFNLASLERLTISGCHELESLPEQIWESLQSLRILKICNCEGLRWLPEGIRHLTSLEFLEIEGCPTLEERCKEGTGEDWDKIAHISELYIG
ncbi:hypothetical protein TSUD_215170 [Trifolium subterraneum]|uniref:Uncharacterized protein n=1 Tax=Trifolium subterraneum TaxID=3900 RepID=A0A2Z6MGC6_TRISU|nr:hypothetical protein TSUD_215170 [Trifolium subterraneum]